MLDMNMRLALEVVLVGFYRRGSWLTLGDDCPLRG